MDERSPSDASSNAADRSGASKQAACLSCRKSKTRCLRGANDAKCRRCTQTATECIVPEYHVGRKKGIKNKRTGLDKAVFRIEQALKKTKKEEGPEAPAAQHLQSLLNEAQGLLPTTPAPLESSMRSSSISSAAPRASISGQLQLPPPLPNVRPPVQPRSNVSEDYMLDSAENPLQLLARASDLSASQQYAQSPHSAFSRTDTDLQSFFGPFQPKLDVGEDIDPIDMGYVNHEEAELLFNYFYNNLSHTRWGMDRQIHTAKFVRSRSAFLFTSIMAAASLFIPTAASLSKRLSVHSKKLAQHVIVNRTRSPEVVLAFMVNIPWMSPGRHWQDDETCTYMAMALTIATDISLDKVIVSSTPSGRLSTPPGLTAADCITAKKALELDGFQEVDPGSSLGQRLLRRRERVWLSLFVLDRGVCLARGRSFTVPITPLVKSCDDWHKSDMTDTWDGSIIASAVMRRDLVDLIEDVKHRCAVVGSHGDLDVAESIQNMIEGFFNRWYAAWAYSIHTEGDKRHHLPPYVDILVTHLRLSIYSIVMNHPAASIEVKKFFRAAGLASALNVMRVAVQGEGQLKSIPNNSSIMISFAALFALRLSILTTGAGSLSLAPSIKTLIEETADVLERIGSTPRHRKGAAALYGRHLREVVNSTAIAEQGSSSATPDVQRSDMPLAAHHAYIDAPQHSYQNPHSHSSSLNNNNNASTIYHQQQQRQQQQQHPQNHEPAMQFSAMSDYQIVEAVRDAGEELESCLPNFSMDDERTGLDWLDWFSAENPGIL